mgnify:CR=1 FL=1
MITQDLRIGIAGDTAMARGVAFQTEATSGMVVTWKTTDDPTSLLEENNIENLQLPDTPLIHLWIKQRELLESSHDG